MVLESFAKGDAPGSAAMPACIVLERWDYSLSDWNNKLQRQPDDVELQSALYMVSPLALACPFSDLPLLCLAFALACFCSDLPFVWLIGDLDCPFSDLPLLCFPFALACPCSGLPLLVLTHACLSVIMVALCSQPQPQDT